MPPKKSLNEEYIETLKKNYDNLILNIDKMIESNNRLVNVNITMVKTNQKVIKAYISFMDQQTEKAFQPKDK
ncbi:MAG TPA: hypothetical protein VK563_20375 [Puia sp.]|nr:hypothetical protein [Puia sp.]